MGYWSPEARRAHRSKNLTKFREQEKLYRLANLEKRQEQRRKRQVPVDSVVYEAKSRPCRDCGNTFPACAMQFDHVRGEKVANVAHLRNWENVPKVIDEIAKCEVVCANCHAIRTCKRDTRHKSRRCSHVEPVDAPDIEANVADD